LQSEAGPGKSVRPYLKNKLKSKETRGVAWAVQHLPKYVQGTEFNPQYCPPPSKKKTIRQPTIYGVIYKFCIILEVEIVAMTSTLRTKLSDPADWECAQPTLRRHQPWLCFSHVVQVMKLFYLILYFYLVFKCIFYIVLLGMSICTAFAEDSSAQRKC
jgi:hypothetical protein